MERYLQVKCSRNKPKINRIVKRKKGVYIEYNNIREKTLGVRI